MNDHLNKFKSEIQDLKEIVRTTRKDVLRTGDFNTKSTEWGETRPSRSGMIVKDMLARIILTVINTG